MMVGRYDVSQVKGVESQYAAATNGGAGIKGQISVYLGNGAPGGVTPSQVTAVVHDGITPGGHKMQRADGSIAYSRLTSVPPLVANLATVSGSGILGVSGGALSLLTTTATGNALITAADPAAARSTLGLGATALLNVVLDGMGKWPSSTIPALDLTAFTTVANQTERLALPVSAGSYYVVQADTGINWGLNPNANPAVSGNWIQLNTVATSVTSAFGKTGAVTGATLDALAGPLASTDLLVVRDISANADGTVPVSQLLSLVPAGISLSSTTPSPLGTAAVGSGTTAARSNHVHAHGDQLGGTLHALATTTEAGFQSAADKVKLNGIADGATQTPLSNALPAAVGVANIGVGTSAARSDHVHALPLLINPATSITARVDVASTETLPTGGVPGQVAALTYWRRLTGNATITLPALVPTAGANVEFILRIDQDGTGGRTLALSPPAGHTIVNDGGSFAAPATAANSVTLYYVSIAPGDTKFLVKQGFKS